MDEALKEIYQQVILDHNKNPRNFRKIENATHVAEGFNPLCGDHLWVYLTVEDDVIVDVSFQGSGCAISKSSASMMTTALKGERRENAEAIFNHFHDVITGKPYTPEELDALGKLAIFQGVKDFPARVKCASLAWHTFESAIHNKQSVSTEVH